MAPHNLIDTNVSNKSAASVFSTPRPRFLRERASDPWCLSLELYGIVLQKAVPVHTHNRKESQIPQTNILKVLYFYVSNVFYLSDEMVESAAEYVTVRSARLIVTFLEVMQISVYQTKSSCL